MNEFITFFPFRKLYVSHNGRDKGGIYYKSCGNLYVVLQTLLYDFILNLSLYQCLIVELYFLKVYNFLNAELLCFSFSFPYWILQIFLPLVWILGSGSPALLSVCMCVKCKREGAGFIDFKIHRAQQHNLCKLS